MLDQRLRKVALSAKQFANQPVGDLWNRRTGSNIAWCEAKCEQLATVIEHEMELKAEAPANRGLATLGLSTKHAMPAAAPIVAYGKFGGINKRDTVTASQALMQIEQERHKCTGNELNTARVAYACGKLAVSMLAHMLGVDRFEVAVV